MRGSHDGRSNFGNRSSTQSKKAKQSHHLLSGLLNTQQCSPVVITLAIGLLTSIFVSVQLHATLACDCSLFDNSLLLGGGSLRSNNNAVTTTRSLYSDKDTSTRRFSSENELSACLLVMDDNHYLIEWLAYHYHVANLRHVILTSDPNSKTRPTHVLERWKGLITFEEWEESDFLPDDFEKRVKRRAGGQDKNSTNQQVKTKSVTLQNHRERQAWFNLNCLRSLKRQGREWVMMLDTDEYLTAHPDLMEQSKNATRIVVEDKQHKKKRKGHDEIFHLAPISQPGSMFILLNSTVIPSITYPNAIDTPCVAVNRIQFAARESEEEKVQHLVPDGFDGLQFQTLRWRKHGYDRHHRYETAWGESCSIRRDVPNKVCIDLGRLRMQDLYHPDNKGNPHHPLESICPENVYIRQDQTPFSANHYMGTPEQWLYRVGDKRGAGYRQARYEDLNQNIGIKETDRLRPWLAGFVKTMGEPLASELLKNVGVLEPLPVMKKEQDGGTGDIEETQTSFVQKEAVYQVGDIVQSNFHGEGDWGWAEVTAVHANAFYNVHYYEDCSEDIATFAERLRQEGEADDVDVPADVEANLQGIMKKQREEKKRLNPVLNS